MWPQEGTITQHYQSQQSSCIKADRPTLIYSLISGHQLMSLFWATERLWDFITAGVFAFTVNIYMHVEHASYELKYSVYLYI